MPPTTSGAAVASASTQQRSFTGEYAGFWRRLLASFIDATILFIARVLLTLLTDAFGLDLLNESIWPDIDARGVDYIMPAGSIITIALGLSYFGYLESSAWQATIGKFVLGIYVTGMDGERITPARAVGRHLASWISDASFMIGYLIQPFTRKRQALHDIIASTLVLKR